MNCRIDESSDHPIVDSRANLFFFLQTLAKETQARTIERKASEFSVADEQPAEFNRNNGMI